MEKPIKINSGADSLAIIGDQIVSIAESAEKRIEAIKKIKSIVLTITNEQDWIDENGKPYLQASGAEKVARLFGISWRIDEPVIEKDENGHYTYTYKGYFSLGACSIEAIGTRSSRDPFFTTKYKNGKRLTIGPSEIDREDVKKAAYTNCIGNGIKRLLGIRNLTWEEIKINKEEISSIKFKKNAPDDDLPSPPPTADQIHKEFPPKNEPEKLQPNEVITTVEDGEIKSGTSQSGEKWTMYIFTCADGNRYRTFDEKLADIAIYARREGTKIGIKWKQSKYGREIIDLWPEEIPKEKEE